MVKEGGAPGGIWLSMGHSSLHVQNDFQGSDSETTAVAGRTTVLLPSTKVMEEVGSPVDGSRTVIPARKEFASYDISSASK